MAKGIYWLASYPKSGNTWFRVYMHNLLHQAAHPVSINNMGINSIATSRPWIDTVLGFDSSDLEGEEIEELRPEVYQWTAQHSNKHGYHKIHDACRQLTSGEYIVSEQATAGAVYFIRNPLDVAISMAHHNEISVDETIEILNETDTRWCVSNHSLHQQLEHQLLSWSGHVKSWVDNNAFNTKVVRFEDMKHKPLKTFSSATMFLQIPACKTEIKTAIRHSDFKELQAQEKKQPFSERRKISQPFFRQGRTGDWKQTLNENQISVIIDNHGETMKRFGYLDDMGNPQIM